MDPVAMKILTRYVKYSHSRKRQGDSFFVKRTGLFYDPNLLLPLLPGWGEAGKEGEELLPASGAYLTAQTDVVPRGVSVEEIGSEEWDYLTTSGSLVLSELSQMINVGFMS